MMMTLLPETAQAVVNEIIVGDDGSWHVSDDTGYYYSFNPDTGTITHLNLSVDCSTDIVFPAEIKNGTTTSAVTSIGNSACSFTGITSVRIPSSVTSIGDTAFMSTWLESVEIPDSVTQIGTSAFRNSDRLKHVTLSNSLQEIGNSVFDGCSALESIEIPASVQSIGHNAFGGCTSLRELTLPGVTEIDWSAFSGCTSLQGVRFQGNLTVLRAAVGSVIFSGCDSLTWLALPASLERIDGDVFPAKAELAPPLTDIYFAGSEEQWKKVTIASDPSNDVIRNATIHYNSTGPSAKPEEPAPSAQIKVEITAPDALENLPDGSGYANNPFAVTAKVTNQGEEALQVKMRLDVQQSAGALQSGAIPARTVNPGTSETFTGQVEALLQASQVEVPFTVVLENGEGTTLYRENRSITLPRTTLPVYTVKFDLNGGTGTQPAEQVLPQGSKITYPNTTPVRDGYIFDGWYSYYDNSFWFQKLTENTTVQRDMVFQASWSKRTEVFQMGIDNLRFANTDADFFNSGEGKYCLLDAPEKDILLNQVFSGSENSDKTYVMSKMGIGTTPEEWGGSCFGMCAAVVLMMHGKLSPAYFQTGAIHAYDLKKPRENISVRNMVNYYYLVQYVSDWDSRVPNLLTNNDTRAHLKALVDTLEKDEGPVILRIGIEKRTPGEKAYRDTGGHIILAYGCEKTASGDYYDINIWNPNRPNETHKLFIKSDFSQKCIDQYDGKSYDSNGTEIYERRSTISYFAGFNETSYYDFVNLQNALTAKNTAGTVKMSSRSQSRTVGTDYILYTSYPEFTIACSDGTSAEVENGRKVSGDIEISDGEWLNDYEYNSEIRFRLPRLNPNETYSVTPKTTTSIQTGTAMSQYTTVLLSSDAQTGFCAQVAAQGSGRITFFGSGKVETAFDSATTQCVTVTRNDLTTPWYMISADSTTTRLCSDPSADSTVISAENPVTVSVYDDFNTAHFDPVEADGGIRVEESADGDRTAVIIKGDTVEASKELGHSVVFYTLYGSTVDTQTNIPNGGKAVRPADPIREGYTFAGWYKEAACTTAWNFDTDTVTGNIKLYAKWTAKTTGDGSGSGGGSSSGGGGSSSDDSSSDDGDSYTPPTYPPTVECPSKGGTVTVTPSRPGVGDKVTVRPKPDTGYQVDQVTVTGKNGKPVTVKKNPDGTYTFTQPNGTVKVKVSYKTAEAPWSNPFGDVSENAWYYDAVRYVTENGLMNGYGDGRFVPNDNLTRAQLAQILFNKEGKPGVNYFLQFGDVPGEAWYTEAVRWAASQGIVCGYGDGRFGPNDHITREQLAVMLWRYAGSPAATNKELRFHDIDEIGGFAINALRWAVENGILNGYSDGRLGSKGLATRAQVAQILMNFLKNQ